MGAARQLQTRIVRALKDGGLKHHDAETAARIVVQAIQPARLDALCRLFVDSGDMTPYAAMRMRAALGLSDEREG